MLAVLLLELEASPALSAPPEEMSVADLERSGREAVQAQRYEAALDDYRDVYLRERTTAHLWNLALAQLAAHDSVSALLSLRQYTDAPDAEPRHRAMAAQLVADIYGETGHLAFSGEATVWLDGRQRSVGRETEADVQTGDHTVSSNAHSPPMHVNAPAGKVVLVDLTRLPAVGAIGEKVTATALSTSPVSPKRSAKWPTTIAFGASALAVAGGAVALNLMAIHTANASSAQRVAMGLPDWACNVIPNSSDCQTLASNMRTFRAEATASVVLYSTAGALAATSMALGLFWHTGDAPRARDAWLAPVIAPGTFGASAGGSF